MGDSSRENIGQGLKIHRHESPIGGSETAYLAAVYIFMFLAEEFHALDDIFRCPLAPGIDMAR